MEIIIFPVIFGGQTPPVLRYLQFLSNLLKDHAYVSMSYMTGILPISKYSSGSELNMFMEFKMTSMAMFGEYFGFTDEEVDVLYDKYLHLCKDPQVSREGLREWYDGYFTASGRRLYNPRSVVMALRFNQLSNYWTSSGPYFRRGNRCPGGGVCSFCHGSANQKPDLFGYGGLWTADLYKGKSIYSKQGINVQI